MTKAGALRKRYIHFEVNGSEFKEEELKRGLYEQGLKFFGEYELSFVGLKLIEYRPAGRNGVLRCTRDKVEEVLGFLALINELNGERTRVISKKTRAILPVHLNGRV
ncbi:hypothetical protein HZC08_01430, partial [Candidatus Micrarchaeota archaeon]|nr:hypothetical protein [Candidatus Micrarchaeota archaeon]